MTSHIMQSGVSRRSLIRALATVPFVAMAATKALAAKLSQKSVGYQNHPRGSQSCSSCRLYRAPNECAEVQGPISPHGWCHIYNPK